MRIVVLGTGPFAVPMFRSLLASAHEVPALITRPTPAAKSRDKAPPNSMQDAAEAHGVPVHAPTSINSPEGQQILTDLKPDLLVVCDYGQILAPDILAAAPLGGINLHASLLPRYRGAAPIQWALLNGDTETGVSVIHMTPRLDAGPILTIRRTPIGEAEAHPELEGRIAQLGIEAVHEAIAMLDRWDRSSPLGQMQDAALASKAPRLKKEQGQIDWSRSAKQIFDQVRAFKPWPLSYTFLQRAGHEPLRLTIDQVERVTDESPARGTIGDPGTVLVSDGKSLHVATGNGTLAITALQPAGKRIMPIADFLRGYLIRPGDLLGASS